MANYRKMYLEMCHACDDAVEILIKARQLCEELYISSQDVCEVVPFPLKEHKE